MRLLIVSNRLPVTAVEKEGEIEFRMSAGGLVSGLSAYLDSMKHSNRKAFNYVWVGWPGVDVPDAQKDKLRTKLFDEAQALPVFMSEKVMDNFYHGFCNSTIWPIFHYFPSYAVFRDEYWNDYRAVNEAFCEAVLEIVKEGDVVWVHDYHLMCLPGLLREKRPDLKIGFFLHIPFPSFEIFRLLPAPWRSGILKGLLGADLVGFHTNDYTQYFLHCVLRILGLEHNMGQMIADSRLVSADTFPMGIDFNRFFKAASDPEVQAEIRALKIAFVGQKVVLSVDRLDYSKGIINRLRGFENFLQANPAWHGKVVLVLVLVPSRVGVEQYQQMKRRIDEYVGFINGKYGRLDWTPISYQYKFLSFPTLAALYAISDLGLVTPLRDGMNLVAKEYVASRPDGTGVLVLSEMAGASRELGEALIVNPTTGGEIADALKMALEMPVEEQIKRNQAMQERLRHYDVVRWAEDFIGKLSEVRKEQDTLKARVMKPAVRDELAEKFRAAQRRILLLDYDGTLVPFSKRPEASLPGADLMSALKRLASDVKTDVVIISGRRRNALEKWFGELPIHLIAEHGVWIKKSKEDWRLIKPLRNDWKPQILPILKMSADRLPGAFVEEKEYSLVWHYRNADPELASVREKELIDDLVQFTANIDLQVVCGHKIVEVKNAGVSKGNAAIEFLGASSATSAHFVEKLADGLKSRLDHPAGGPAAYDFILAVGDDTTDEDLFKVLPNMAWSIRVGLANSRARFNLPGHHEVFGLLQKLIGEG
ncbi:MAG: bifunctional alpha,alpha-trehalose-phosphate synthase (UDP-forming)/trehalose-phosphatase [Deltaproteobacteria bacterium]|nr:bifunctional alpha,alpha-trehalose-phosphate synthase (UDP-forming)/trehalose-phosphatase [Deltaproteobacteria bacterium]